jgi:hypothetical protein
MLLGRRLGSVAVIGSALAVAGCGASVPRFPLAPPMWVDHDARAFSPRPDEWYSSWGWDGADNSVLRPLSEAFTLELDREATNVSSVDEVPDSSWYTNRLSRRALSPAEVAWGACGDDRAEPRGPFAITRGKPDGASPGFFVRDPDGVTYLMKTDGHVQPERASAADAIGASVYWAAGYFAPCNGVVLVSPEELVLEADAEARHSDGHSEPLTREMVDAILENATRAPDGRLRFGISRFVEGDPIAPWRYEGTWDDDPNDVVPHEHRRELRGMYVLASWLSHIDSRQENTLAAWMEVSEGRGYVRHYVIDFGDSLGILFPWGRLARRFGHSGYFDVGDIALDFVSLGLLERPWDRVELGPGGETLGYFDVSRYEPDGWRPGYPNPAFDRRTERDTAWMARILARFSDAHVEALVARARLSSETVRAELTRTLEGRRDRALERWLTRLSPLAHPIVTEDAAHVCVEDLTISSALRRPAERAYAACATRDGGETRASATSSDATGHVCARLPRGAGASVEHPSYLVVEVSGRSRGRDEEGVLRVHAYDLGVSGVRVVGLERPDPGSTMCRSL